MSQALDFFQALKNKDTARARRIMADARTKQQVKEIAMIEDELTVDDVLGLPATNGTGPKRKYSRRATASEEITEKKKGKGSRTATSTKTNTLTLTSEQLAKLWKLTTGGQLIIDDTDDGAPVYHVSLDSLQTALPKILETL